MPGFRYCQWCSGKGCILCDAEEKKWAAAALARAPKHRPPDVRDIRDAVVESELLRSYMPGLTVDHRGRIDAMTPDEVEAVFKPLLDAEYARQFPDGPKPMLTIRSDDPAEMAILRGVVGREAIEHAFGPDGGGMAEIEEKAAKAREDLAAIGKPGKESP